jgi:hypothetical protein
LIKLLEEDKEFRYTVAGLIGYKEVMDRLADKEINKPRPSGRGKGF